MTFEELQEKHAMQLTEFYAAKSSAHAEMRERHEELRQAFSGKDMPSNIRARMNTDVEKHYQKWGVEGSEIQHLNQKQAKDLSDWRKVERLKERISQQQSRDPSDRHEREF